MPKVRHERLCLKDLLLQVWHTEAAGRGWQELRRRLRRGLLRRDGPTYGHGWWRLRWRRLRPWQWLWPIRALPRLPAAWRWLRCVQRWRGWHPRLQPVLTGCCHVGCMLSLHVSLHCDAPPCSATQCVECTDLHAHSFVRQPDQHEWQALAPQHAAASQMLRRSRDRGSTAHGAALRCSRRCQHSRAGQKRHAGVRSRWSCA
mmetsp:Transcript_45310/g.144398  ORF Transcript_45310/g.144398 Transcript_45310/m.144398 type:complete len:202 (+) Transcript_45310:620-1225(+)